MKRLLILAALACVGFPSISKAETIACAAEVPAGVKGHWYYRIIDGRKCWYDGKPMMPKTSLYWPKSTATDAKASTAPEQRAAAPVVAEDRPVKPATDGRSVAMPSSAAEPVAWPAPAVTNEISFESRWLGLHSKN
jgi:hypothetical protein